jgi:hypothetical protein
MKAYGILILVAVISAGWLLWGTLAREDRAEARAFFARNWWKPVLVFVVLGALLYAMSATTIKAF